MISVRVRQEEVEMAEMRTKCPQCEKGKLYITKEEST